jgi:hypothetical protein
VCGVLRIRSASARRRIDDEVSAAVQSEIDLGRLDATVEVAIRRGRASGLRVLGFGEITLVLGWPPERPVLAVKRLPVFRDLVAVEAYARLVADYDAALRERGVGVVDTVVRTLAAPDGVHVYLVQPLVPREQVLSVALAGAAPPRAEQLLERLADAVCAAVDAGVGLDAQAGNWAVGDDDELALFDVSTPLMRDPTGATGSTCRSSSRSTRPRSTRCCGRSRTRSPGRTTSRALSCSTSPRTSTRSSSTTACPCCSPPPRRA